ncbi:MAG: hypothetical protein HN909_03565 [Phycisphaerales bacterium]|jgi:tetratricopeptide (TPR) repeat protein|nr:hypothetical protein [Phycisphaerales bacterium]MBT7170830.1 hypothetical protein [Phycisphaerales bacterium]
MADTAGKGKAFFDRADQVAATSNWDFAIEMYAEGLKREPENIERGYQNLWEVAVKRKMSGGKAAGFGDKRSHKTNGKDLAENLVNTWYLLAKDTSSDELFSSALKLAVDLEFQKLVRWTCEILVERQKQLKKPSKRACVAVIDASESLKYYDLAVTACQLALRAVPNDAILDNRLRELGAQYTLQKGRYAEDGKKFTDTLAGGEEAQRDLQESEQIIKSDDFLQRQVEKKRQEYLADPEVPGKINAFVDALLQLSGKVSEAEAIQTLTDAHKLTGAFQYRMRIGDIQSNQFKRLIRQLKESGDLDKAKLVAKKQLLFEISEFKERAANYPTDLGIKYEYGRRLYLAGQFDDAISMLQQAQRDPRSAVRAMNLLGQAFMKKTWWQEAVDTFDRVLKTDITEDAAKDIRYHLADALEHLGELNRAQEQLSLVAQVDFNFRDVRDRLEAVRAKIKLADG